MATLEQVVADGWAAFRAGDLDRAEQLYLLVVQQRPSTAQAWYMLGAIGQVRGRAEEAVVRYEQAIRLVPNFPEACNNLGVALHALHRGDASIAALRRAIALNPDYAEAHNNLGNALHDRGELDQAEACYRRALAIKPDYVEAHHNLGNVLRSLGRMAEAIAAYDRALERSPEHAHLHLSRATAHLAMGEFRPGWAEYEWRLKCPAYAIPSFRRPIWDGRPVGDRTILLYADHGLGDALQFIRYAPPVRERCGRVVVACGAAVARLLATCRGVDLVVVDGAPLPEYEAYAPLMSLPHLLGTGDDDDDTVAPAAEVPYLHVDPALVAGRAAELPESDDLCIGIAWQGNPAHLRDHLRSFQLAEFEPIARLAGVRLFGLQKDHGREQLAEISGRFPVVDLAGRPGDLMDTAAAMLNLDLVIVPDTALAHLAGALGVPAWVALPYAPDWRWMTGRDDSPWYPSLRLFRQRRWNDWGEVFRQMAAELESARR